MRRCQVTGSRSLKLREYGSGPDNFTKLPPGCLSKNTTKFIHSIILFYVFVHFSFNILNIMMFLKPLSAKTHRTGSFKSPVDKM